MSMMYQVIDPMSKRRKREEQLKKRDSVIILLFINYYYLYRSTIFGIKYASMCRVFAEFIFSTEIPSFLGNLSLSHFTYFLDIGSITWYIMGIEWGSTGGKQQTKLCCSLYTSPPPHRIWV